MPDRMERMMGFAVIGTSGHADRIAAPVLAANPEAKLLGAAGGRLQGGAAFAARHGLAKAYERIEDLLSDKEVEAVWICSPNHLHATHVIAAAQARKHVLVEKPLSLSLADAEAAIAAAEASGCVLQVGYQHRFRPSHVKMREILRQGVAGQIGYFRIHRFWRYPYFDDMDPAGPPAWRQAPETSGGWVINDIGAHLIDLAFWLTGKEGRFVAAALASQRFDVATEDSAALMIELGSGGIGYVEASAANDSPGSSIEIYGDKGWIRAEDTLSGEARIIASDGGRFEFQSLQPLDTYALQLHDFLLGVRAGPSIGATGKEAMAVTKLIADAVTKGIRIRRAGLENVGQPSIDA